MNNEEIKTNEPEVKKDETKKKNPGNYLKKEIRDKIITQLKDMGASAEGLNDDELLNKLSETSAQLHKDHEDHVSKYVSKEADILLNQLKEYINVTGCRLKNQKFIERLYRLNVPQIYLHLFKDEDMTLEDEGIWAIIRGSGINPIKNVVDVFKIYRR